LVFGFFLKKNSLRPPGLPVSLFKKRPRWHHPPQRRPRRRSDATRGARAGTSATRASAAPPPAERRDKAC